jgi:signal transduction histidine kinase
MRRRILLTIVVITALAVGLFAIPLGVVVQRHYLDEATLKLEREAILAASRVPSNPAEVDADDVAPGESGTRLALYDTTGRRVIGDGPATGDQPVANALRNQLTDTEHGGRLVVAVPVAENEQVFGVVRAERALSAVSSRTLRAWLLMAALAVFIVVGAALVAWRQSARLTRPVEAVRDGARRLGDGDFATHVAASGVPELDDLADALNQTGERLGKLVARERSFSADASHQLRTPLTALRLSLETELAMPRDDRNAVVREALTAIDRLEATTEDLLALARDQRPGRAPLDVDAVLDGVEARWRDLFSSRGRRLVVSPPPAGEAPAASAAAIGHALDVLVDNAVQHGTGTVTVEAHPVHGGVAITVADEGPGLRGDPARLFERTVPRADGHGIGLALARTLVEAEGGRLVVDRPQPAPRFEIVLPAENGSSPE